MSEQVVFTLKYLGLHDEEENKTNARNPLTEGQRQSGRFLSFMMTIHPYQADPKCKHGRMHCRDCI